MKKFITRTYRSDSIDSIEKADQELLQLNLIRSHATGIGEPLSIGICRAIMVLKLLTYAKGYSGIRLELAEKIIQFLNKDIVPFIHEKGSVGASGDLATLAHLGLALIGEGFSFYKGKKMKTITALDKAIRTVNNQRSQLGAVSNRLSHTVNNLTNISANLSAAQGGIEDADLAKETTDLAKNQILQQASTAMLAQANARAESVVQL